MKRWVRGRAAENRSLFCPLGFASTPYFYFLFFIFFEKVVVISGASFIFAFSIRMGCKNQLNLY